MDSTARISQTLLWALEDAGLSTLTDAERRDVIGLGLADAMRQLAPTASDQQCEQLVSRYRYHWLKEDAPKTALFAGVRECLQGLMAAGHVLAVATGKSRAGLDKDLASTGIADLFAASRCADETQPKPYPHMLNELMQELSFSSSHCLMIGDSVHDLGMAKAAQVAGVGVLTGVHDHARMQAFAPLAVLNHVDELPQWLQQC